MSKVKIINEEIKLNVKDLVEILQDYSDDPSLRPDGFIDNRIHIVVNGLIERAIHNIADELEHKYKIGVYDGRYDDRDDT